MFIKLLGDCFSSCDLWTSDVCWEGCCAPTLPGLVSLCAECTEELLSDFETFCSDCCWSEYGHSNFCCEADGLLRICGVAFSDHRVGWEEPCCCCCCASNCFCSLGGCCAIGTLELWVPDLELPTTPVLPPFMNWGSVVGTPRRYFGEFGPEAVDVTIVFTGSALTDGGGLTCQKQKNTK